jgi:hypothetical protein
MIPQDAIEGTTSGYASLKVIARLVQVDPAEFLHDHHDEGGRSKDS